MSKTSIFTTITPLPRGITRQSVIDTYHSHVEMIELNPLVVERFKCKPPNYAPSDEFYSTWYTIKGMHLRLPPALHHLIILLDKVNYLPGGLASGSVSYHAVFHDLPDGLQTHVYAPLGLDIRAKWSVGGSLPGEPLQKPEMGLEHVPRTGLYVREDVRIKCNIMMMSFVKKTFKESHSKLVERLVEKAHLIESENANERLRALREVGPKERMGHGDIFIAPPPGYELQPDMNGQHISIYSNKSESSASTAPNSMNEHSPGLSQSSTATGLSTHPSSPPYHAVNYPREDQHASISIQYQDEFEAYQRERSESAATLPSLSFLPSTTYDPSCTKPQHKRSHSHDVRQSTRYVAFPMYKPTLDELRCEGPPVPPKDKDKDKRFVFELPA
jgi:hypothetical protein